MEFFGYFTKYYIDQAFGWNYIATMAILCSQITLVMNSKEWNLKGILWKTLDFVITFLIQLFFFCFWEYFFGSHVYINYIVWPIVIFCHFFYFCSYKFFDKLSKGVSLTITLYLEPMIASSLLDAMELPTAYFDYASFFIVFFFGLLSTLFLSKFTLKKTENINYICFFLLLFLVAFTLVLILTDLPEGEVSLNAISHLSIYFLIAIFAMISYYFFYRINVDYSQALDNQAILLKEEKNKETLEASQANLENLRKRRYDMKNQYQYMRLLLENGDKKKLNEFFQRMIEGSDVTFAPSNKKTESLLWQERIKEKYPTVVFSFHNNLEKEGEKNLPAFEPVFDIILQKATPMNKKQEIWLEGDGSSYLLTLSSSSKENKTVSFPDYEIHESCQKDAPSSFLKTFRISQKSNL